MQRILPPIGIVLILICAPGAAESQSDLRVRAQADSIYAVRLLVEQFAESVRTGRLDPQISGEPALQSAVAELARARAGGRAAPRRELGPAWDFRFAVETVEPSEDRQLIVRGTAYLEAAPELAKGPVLELVFQRTEYGNWMLVRADGLVARLNSLRSRAGARGDDER